MALIVQKYGGTSIGSVERIQEVAANIKSFRQQNHDIVVVVSAMSGETNRLIDLARAIQMPPDPRELDVLMSTGEQVTIALLVMALKQNGVDAISYTGSQVKIRTDNAYTKARIEQIDTGIITQALAVGRVVVVAGFQGINTQGHITTLGRGGSDITGVALAAVLKADECQIYTDVDGVYTTDPRVVSTARRLDQITFEEMLEMASLGSKVLQIRAVKFAGQYQVKLRVLSSFVNGAGTLITFEENNKVEKAVISGVAFSQDEARINVQGIPDKPGVAYQILGPISDANIEVDMIIQNVGVEGITDFSFTVSRADYQKSIEILQQNNPSIHAQKVTGDAKICKVSVIGVGMRSHVGIASTMFQALATEGINIQMISTSEIKISIVLDEKYVELAVRVLHKAFQLDRPI